MGRLRKNFKYNIETIVISSLNSIESSVTNFTQTKNLFSYKWKVHCNVSFCYWNDDEAILLTDVKTFFFDLRLLYKRSLLILNYEKTFMYSFQGMVMFTHFELWFHVWNHFLLVCEEFNLMILSGASYFVPLRTVTIATEASFFFQLSR